jgi:hypothetical protein
VHRMLWLIHAIMLWLIHTIAHTSLFHCSTSHVHHLECSKFRNFLILARYVTSLETAEHWGERMQHHGNIV